jgi:hypothetical protein
MCTYMGWLHEMAYVCVSVPETTAQDVHVYMLACVLASLHA